MKDLIVTINSNTRKTIFSKNFLGINGENLQGNIIVDFEDEFVDGVAYLETDNGSEKYLIGMEKVEKHYVLPIRSSLLTVVGKLTCQIRINSEYDENTTAVFKSEKFEIPILEAVNATETIPEQYPTWLEQADLELIKVQTATNRANAISEDLEEKVETDYYRGATGPQGTTGNGISCIVKTGTVGLIDTYTIYFTDGTTFDYTVKNGSDADIEANPTDTATDTLNKLKINGTVYGISGGAVVTEHFYSNISKDDLFNYIHTLLANGKHIFEIRLTLTQAINTNAVQSIIRPGTTPTGTSYKIELKANSVFYAKLSGYDTNYNAYSLLATYQGGVITISGIGQTSNASLSYTDHTLSGNGIYIMYGYYSLFGTLPFDIVIVHD